MASFGADGGAETIELQLTPMLDVFSILVTFLLMSFSTDPVSHDVNPELELPKSATMVALDEIPTIAVTTSEILINDKKVSSIMGGDVPEQDIAQEAIQPVYEELVKLKKAGERRQVAEMLQEEDEEKKKLGTLTMEMDKGHKFLLMRRIMISAQQAEYLTFKLMVAKNLDN